MEYTNFDKEFVERTKYIVETQCRNDFKYDVMRGGANVALPVDAIKKIKIPVPLFRCRKKLGGFCMFSPS